MSRFDELGRDYVADVLGTSWVCQPARWVREWQDVAAAMNRLPGAHSARDVHRLGVDEDRDLLGQLWRWMASVDASELLPPTHPRGSRSIARFADPPLVFVEPAPQQDEPNWLPAGADVGTVDLRSVWPDPAQTRQWLHQVRVEDIKVTYAPEVVDQLRGQFRTALPEWMSQAAETVTRKEHEWRESMLSQGVPPELLGKAGTVVFTASQRQELTTWKDEVDQGIRRRADGDGMPHRREYFNQLIDPELGQP